MTWIPGSADGSQVMTMLRKLATSATMSAELQAAQADLQPGALVFQLHDKDNRTAPPFETFDLSEEDYADAGWLDTQIQRAQVAEALTLTAPFPAIELIGQPPGADPFEEQDVRAHLHRIAAVIFCNGDHEQLVQRAAMVTAECYGRAVCKDGTLGGLVRWIRQTGAVEAGGGGRHKDGPVVMASRVTFEAMVIQP